MMNTNKSKLSGESYVLVEMDPYESGEVQGIIGPFDSKTAAQVGKDLLLESGVNEDCEYYVFQIKSLKSVVDQLKEDNEDDELVR